MTASRAALQIYTRDTQPTGWALAQNNLGVALVTLGKRRGADTGIEALGEAVTAYRVALEIYSRETMPAAWEMTQEILATAQQILEERRGRPDHRAIA